MKQQREQLVKSIQAHGVRNPLVLAAMRAVHRELFVPDHLRRKAYADTPHPIGSGQTISQPFIVAFMIEALACTAARRCSRSAPGPAMPRPYSPTSRAKSSPSSALGSSPRRQLPISLRAGCGNVHIRHADGTEGWDDEAPFDAILVSAGAPDVPKPLVRQLKIGGHLVVPVGSDPRSQELVRVTRAGEDEFEREYIGGAHFVPLIGKEGWGTDARNLHLGDHQCGYLLRGIV